MAVSIALAATLMTTAMPSAAIEEPPFAVVRKTDGIEVRTYPPYVVAEVVVDGSADEAGNAAFRILAAYIFGKNKGEKKLSMTAPVTQTAAPGATPAAPASPSAPAAKLAMTAPVTQTARSSTEGGGYLVQFVLPKDVTLETAPEPLDARVKLRLMPPQKVAVITYSGFWSEANYAEHLQQLKSALTKAQIESSGEPVFSRYNPPFMPWFLRRNEIWLAVP